MRALSGLAIFGALLAAWMYWGGGLERAVLDWAAAGQRAAQEGMATALRALRAGEPAAVLTLLGLCFAYGLFHAAGPGHGKLLIGGYGAARAVGPLRLSVVALLASLAQGATAIALVASGLWVLGLGRAAMTDMAERLLQPLGFAAMAAIGLWLALRGLRGLRRNRAGADHSHGPACGHAHAPPPEAIAAATSARELAALVAAVALRPCTGALFLLVLTAQLGVFAWGVAGTLAMALGTASVTVAVALAAVGLRAGVLSGLTGGAARLARVQPLAELGIGLTIAWVAGRLALATL
jgi:ABC-type nickel/cobalt efflux system permease component RcnA